MPRAFGVLRLQAGPKMVQNLPWLRCGMTDPARKKIDVGNPGCHTPTIGGWFVAPVKW